MVIFRLLYTNKVRQNERPHQKFISFIIISAPFHRVKRKQADLGRLKAGKIVYMVKNGGDPHI